MLALVAGLRGDYERAEMLAEQSLQSSRAMGRVWETGTTLALLGQFAVQNGEFDRARPLFEESLRPFRGLGERWGIAFAMRNCRATDSASPSAWRESRPSPCGGTPRKKVQA